MIILKNFVRFEVSAVLLLRFQFICVVENSSRVFDSWRLGGISGPVLWVKESVKTLMLILYF
jgi:hypothetical protein